MKIGIVCEGGGMRGIFTAGVLQSFLNAHFLADLLVGVSAGASNGISYISGQSGRGFRTNVDYMQDSRYLGLGNYLRNGSVFNMDFIFGEIANVIDPLDYETFFSSPCAFWAGATDVQTGQIVFFGKDDLDQQLLPLRASCSIPLLAPMVRYQGRDYLDGGIADPIPLDKGLAEGCERLLVILTRPRAYRKKPQPLRSLYHLVYRRYPELIRALDQRHLVYNATLSRLQLLEQEGRALVIAPPAALRVGRFGGNRRQMTATYQEGLQMGRQGLAILATWADCPGMR